MGHREKRALVTAAIMTSLACGGSATDPGGGGNPPVLTARHGHAMAYDEAHHVILLFGGWGTEETSPAGDRSSLWAWDGTTWTRLATDGPSPRHEASMTYDAGRGRVVLYGGRSGAFPTEAVLSDTWEWDGSAWSRRATAGPSPRVHQSIAYDRARGRTVLFGGFSTATVTELHDIWEWDGAAWTQVSDGPADLVARGLAFDAKAAALYLIGVPLAGGSAVLERWDGATLTPVDDAGPDCAPSLRALVGLGASRGGLFYGGSCNQVHPFETWRWDGAAWGAVTGTQPDARGNHAMAYDATRDRVVLYGGEPPSGGADFADTWEFDGSAWTKR
jgi:hypothetical protein